MSTKMQVQWRRAKVLELSSQGYTQIELATQLQVDEPSISRDMVCLIQQARIIFRSISIKQFQKNTKSVWLE